MAGETFEQWWARHCYEWEPKDRQDALSDVRIGWHACAESQRAEVERARVDGFDTALRLLVQYANRLRPVDTEDTAEWKWVEMDQQAIRLAVERLRDANRQALAAVRGEGEGA